MSLSSEASTSDEDNTRIEKLEKLLKSLQDIKSENGRLRDNFFNLQSIHTELRAGYAELQDENETLRGDLLSREVELSTTVEELAQELEQSYRQFEEAKAHILTQTEAKALEERLRGEIEQPYLAKIDELDNAVHERIEDYSELWKVQEVLKEEAGSAQRRLQNELEVQETRYAALLDEVEETKKVVELFSRDPNELKQRNNELEVRAVAVEQQNQSLLEEVKSEREARLRSEVRAQKDARSLNAERAAWKEQEAALRRANESLRRECAHLKGELEKSKECEDRVGASLAQTQKEPSDHKSASASAAVRRDAERALAESKVAKLRSEFGRERQALEAAVASAEKRVSVLTTQHLKEVKDLREEHKEYVGKLESSQSKLKESFAESSAKDRAAAMEAQKRLSKAQMELDAHAERALKLERTNAQLSQDSESVRAELETSRAAGRRTQADLASAKEESLRTARELEKQSDQCLRLSADAERLEREKRKLQHDLDQVEDRLRDSRRHFQDQLKARESELDESRRSFATERATTTKRHEEAQQAAIKTYSSANAQLTRKLKKAEDNSSRLEREYTLLLIKVAELEAERKELRMQLNFGLSDLSAGSLGLASNLRTLASDIVRGDADDAGADDEVALALAAVGA